MGKTTVRFAEQLFDFRAQTTQNQRADLPRRSVSPVQHDPEGTAASQAADNVLNIGRRNVKGGTHARSLFIVAALQNVPDGQQILFPRGSSPQPDFQPVVLRRIMACRHHDARLPFQAEYGEVQTGRGSEAEIDDVQPGGTQALNQRAVKGRGTEAAVPRDHNIADIPARAYALTQKERAAGPPHLTDEGGVKARPRSASDVAGAKGAPRGGGKRHIVFSPCLK